MNEQPRERRDPLWLRCSRGVLACGVSLVCGALLAVPFLFPALSWTAWLSSAALVAVCRRRTAAAALRHGWCAGIGFYGCAVYWIPGTIRQFAPAYASFAGWMFLAYCAMAGLQVGVFAYGAAKLQRSAPILIYPTTWVALELVWPQLFPWHFGATQFQWITLIQIAEITGAYGVSFLLMWLGAIIWHFVDLLRKRQGPSAALRPVIVLTIALAAVLCFGWQRRQAVQRRLSERPAIRVALVQPKDQPWSKTCEKLSRNVEEEVDLFCWPESAMGGVYPLEQNSLKSTASSSGRRTGRPYPEPNGFLLFGAASINTGPSGEKVYHVNAMLADLEENIIGRYHKRSLVPFGEYIPGEQWFPTLHRFSPFRDRYLPGKTHEPLLVPGIAKLGVLICYEDIVGRLARLSTRAGADVLVNITNDFWFGNSRALEQHLRVALFRAVENKRYLLRSTTTGATAVISPTGEIMAQAPIGTPFVITATVHPMDIKTFYTQWGDVFGWGCVAAVFILGWRSRKMKSSQ